MELEELKQAWSQYDNTLKQNLKLNRDILRNMNLDKSKKELQKPLTYEILSVVILFLTVAFFSGFSVRFITELRFSIPGFVGVLIGIMYLAFAIMKVKSFMQMDYYKSPIITLQKNLNKLEALILRLRKIELYFLPLLVISILPIAFKAIHNIDIYQNIKLLLLEVGLITGISYPVGYWINKHLYDNKIRDVKTFLGEIENFEREN